VKAGSSGALRNNAVLSLAVFLIQFGEELWTRFLPKLLQTLGAGVVTIGLVGTIHARLPLAIPGRAHRQSRSFVLFTGLAIWDAAHRGRTVESYYLVRIFFVIPISFVGSLLFRQDPTGRSLREG